MEELIMRKLQEQQFRKLASSLVAFFLVFAFCSKVIYAQNTAVSLKNKGADNFLKEKLLFISPKQSFKELETLADEFSIMSYESPEELNLKMLNGYIFLFLAQKYLEQKNFIKAAEYSKKGFYLIDEAAETTENDFKRRYLRLRMDAFIGQNKLRCPIAKSDLNFLMQQESELLDLKPMIMLLEVSYSFNCEEKKVANQLFTKLKALNYFDTETINNIAKNIAPKWHPTELELLFDFNKELK